MSLLQSISKNGLGQLVARFRGGRDIVIGEFMENVDTVIGQQASPTDNTYYAMNGLNLALTQGLYLVGYSAANQGETPTGASAVYVMRCRLRDVTNNVDICGSAGGKMQVGVADGGWSSQMAVTRLRVGAAGLTLQLQHGFRAYGGSPTVANIYSRGDQIAGGNRVWAMRIGAG